jgi:type IV fimbrial biogenesis protein FimT
MADATGRGKGFTLTELIITILVLAILLVLAVPAMQDLVRNNRVTAQHNELRSLIALAKSEAIRRNEHVFLDLFSTDSGWRAWVRRPGDPPDPGSDCADHPGVIRCAEHRRVTMEFDSGNIEFNNRGFLQPTGDEWESITIVMAHENCSGELQAREILILPTGQVVSERIACP